MLQPGHHSQRKKNCHIMNNSLPIWYDDYSEELRTAGPAVMLIACFLKYAVNSIGFYHLKLEVVSRATGVSVPAVNEAIPVLERIGFLRYHADTQTVWLINHARRNLGHLRANNKKNILLANTEFAAIPKECPLRVDFLWQHALMLRLEVQGASQPGDVNFESEDDMLSDLLPKPSQQKMNEQVGGREI